MSIAGKKSVHFIKKDIASQKTPAIGFKNLRFAHKATLGDTVINLASLTLPTEDNYASFVNPSLSELNSAQLLFNQKNLILISSLTGILSSGSYKVTGNTSIELLDSAADGEIFEGMIAATPRSGVQMVDAMPIVSTGVLAASTDTYAVGQPFSVNKYPLSQQGEILVFLDGQLMRRNVGNATASPSADGDYELVDAGGGIGNTVKFNVTSGLDRVVTVVSNGLAFALPNESVMAVVESLAGQVDAMIPTLAALAGVPEGDFQSAPNSVDLKGFGDQVLGLEQNLLEDPTDASQGPRLATTSLAGAITKPSGEIRVHTGNGRGSTANRRRLFTTTVVNTGSSITVAHSATNGSTFTINETGIYAITYGDKGGAQYGCAISRNSNGTTNPGSLVEYTNRLAKRTGAAGLESVLTWIGTLVSGDIMEAITDTAADDTSSEVFLHIIQLAKA